MVRHFQVRHFGLDNLIFRHFILDKNLVRQKFDRQINLDIFVVTGLEARIWALRLGFRPQDWDLNLETGI